MVMPSDETPEPRGATPSMGRATSTFGGLLRRYRTAANLTQGELAERAGLSVRGINDLERGERITPRRETLRLLVDALGLEGEARAEFAAAARHVARKQPTRATRATHAAAVPADPSPTSAHIALPTGTVTFLFTDIEGSTQLVQRLGDVYADVWTALQRLLRAAFATHGGVEVDTLGDGFLVAFPTAPTALAAAAEAARALATHPWPDGVEVRVRMGLHSGAPQLVGDHYVGLDVYRAARIAAAGHGGQLLLSATAAELARLELPEGVSLRDLGAHRLKDPRQEERIFQAVVSGLPADFPALKALDARPHNLPAQPSALLGREREVAEVGQLLRREDVQLVTLTGPGGIGKTRLSLQVAAEALDAFPDGVWNVRLSRLSDPDLVLPAIAQVFDLKELGATPYSEILATYLRDKQLLLVLDNFEQIVATAPEVGELLATCPGVKALVTSRAPLHLWGEREYTLRPLALPDPAHLPPLEQLSQYAAVALFIERAQAAQIDFQVTNQNAPVVAEICVRLDGLPLAIELAATRVKLLPPQALLSRLEGSLSVLTGGAHDLDARQQTMRATLAWSYNLLAPEEQRLFRRLAVFVGGWTLEAAEEVCVAPEGVEPLGLDLLEGLSRLLDQGLIQQREMDDGKPRFSTLYVIRKYALEQLEISGETDMLRRAHADYFRGLATRIGSELGRPGVVVPFEERLAQLDQEHNNLRAALGWMWEQGAADSDAATWGLRAASALGRYWWARGYLREGRNWLEGLLHAAGIAAPDSADVERQIVRIPARVRAQALGEAGAAALLVGDYEAATIRLEAALTEARAAGDRQLAVVALRDLGHIARRQGDLTEAVARFEQSLALAQEAGDDGLEPASILLDLGWTAYYRDDLVGADGYYEAATRFRHVAGHGYDAALDELRGHLALRAGELEKAALLGRQTLTHWWRWFVPIGIVDALALLAKVAATANSGERAARLLGAAASLRETFGLPTLPIERADIERAIAPSRTTIGEEAWIAAFKAGQALSLEAAVAEALSEDVDNG